MRRVLRTVTGLLVAADACQGRSIRRSARAPGVAAGHGPRRDRQGRLPRYGVPPPASCRRRPPGAMRRTSIRRPTTRSPRRPSTWRRPSSSCEEAGATGKTITLAAQGSSIVHSQTADILKANAAELGINIEIKVIPVQRYGSLYWDPKTQEGIDAFLSTWYGNVGDPLDLYATIGPGGSNNYNAGTRPRRGPSSTQRWRRPTTRRGRSTSSTSRPPSPMTMSGFRSRIRRTSSS